MLLESVDGQNVTAMAFAEIMDTLNVIQRNLTPEARKMLVDVGEAMCKEMSDKRAGDANDAWAQAILEATKSSARSTEVYAILGAKDGHGHHVMQKQRAPVLGVRGGDIGTQSAKRAREASDAWAAAIASATGKSPPNSPPASPTSPASPDGGRRVNLNVKRQDGHESFDAALAAVGAEPRSPHRQRVLQRGNDPDGFSRAKSPERLF